MHNKAEQRYPMFLQCSKSAIQPMSDFGERGRRREGANACKRCGDRLFEKGGKMGTLIAQNEATLGAEAQAESFDLCVDCAYSFQDWLLEGGEL